MPKPRPVPAADRPPLTGADGLQARIAAAVGGPLGALMRRERRQSTPSKFILDAVALHVGHVAGAFMARCTSTLRLETANDRCAEFGQAVARAAFARYRRDARGPIANGRRAVEAPEASPRDVVEAARAEARQLQALARATEAEIARLAALGEAS